MKSLASTGFVGGEAKRSFGFFAATLRQKRQTEQGGLRGGWRRSPHALFGKRGLAELERCLRVAKNVRVFAFVRQLGVEVKRFAPTSGRQETPGKIDPKVVIARTNLKQFMKEPDRATRSTLRDEDGGEVLADGGVLGIGTARAFQGGFGEVQPTDLDGTRGEKPKAHRPVAILKAGRHGADGGGDVAEQEVRPRQRLPHSAAFVGISRGCFRGGFDHPACIARLGAVPSKKRKSRGDRAGVGGIATHAATKEPTPLPMTTLVERLDSLCQPAINACIGARDGTPKNGKGRENQQEGEAPHRP